MADVTPDDVITALKGDSEVLLPCVTTPGGTKVMWAKSTETGADRIFTYRFYNEKNIYGTNYKDQTDMYDIADVDENGTKKQLRIRNPTALQSGLYVCTILGGPTNPTYRVQLQVLVPPEQSQFSITVDDTVYADTDQQVTCHITNISPGKDKTRFVIYVGDEVKKRSDDVDEVIGEEENADGTFDLTYSPKVKIEKDYNGKDIACVINWMEDDTTIYKTLTVRKTITVYYKPTQVNISSPGGATVKAGAVMRFHCATDGGNPLPRLFVAKDLVNITGYKDANAADFSVRLTRNDNGQKFQCGVQSSTDNSKFVSTLIIKPNVLFPATKVTIDAPTVMHDGQVYDIRCTSNEGNPDPEIRFRKNGVNGTTHTIPGSYNVKKAERTIRITANRGINGKIFECLLKNDETIKAQTTLKVLYAPTIVSITATSLSVRENTDMTFQCATNGGNPPPQLRIEKRLADGSMTHASPYVTVANILVQLTKNDNGLLFFCRADVLRYINLSTTSVKADVTFDASRVVIEDNIYSSKGGLLEEGVEHDITCKSNEGNPAPVINYHTNGIVGTRLMTLRNVPGLYNAYSTERNLKITPTKEMNERRVECYLENNEDVKTLYKLNVKFPPNGVDIQVASVVKVGEKYTVTCLSNTANPVTDVGMRITWNGNSRQYNNQNSTIDGSYNGQRREFIYSLTARKEDHGHVMTCTAQWRTGATSFKGTTKLNMYYPPVIIIGGSYQNHILEGQDLTLTCGTLEAGNPPFSSYQWKYETQRIDSQEASEYRIQQIAYTDAGTYQCVASNYEGGTATADRTVVVYYAAKSFGDNVKVFYAEQEDNITLSFKFTLLPYDNVQVFWIFNNDKTNVTVNSSSITTERLMDKILQTKYTITSVNKTHLGTYFIKIRNNQVYTQLKEAEFNITFELKGKPVAPDVLSMNWVSPTSLKVTWVVGKDGGFPQTFTVEYWRQGEEQRLKSPTLQAKRLHEVQTYEITGLVANQQYQARVITETQYAGRSMASSAPIVGSTIETSSGENGAVNISMILGITVGLLILVFLVSGGGCFIFLKYKYNFTTKKPGGKKYTANEKHTYANQELLDISQGPNDTDIYEPVQGQIPQAPSMYSRLEIKKQPMVKAAQSEKKSPTYEDTEVAANAATEPEYENAVVAATGVHTEYENTVVAATGDTEYEEPVVATISHTEPEYENTVVPNYEEPAVKDQTYANAQGRQESSIYLTLD